MMSRNTFNYILERRKSKPVKLRRILKNGTVGAPHKYNLMGKERTAEDVIARLESLNPETKWVIA